MNGLRALHGGLLRDRLGDLLLLDGLGALHCRLLRDRLGGEGLLLGGGGGGRGRLCDGLSMRVRLSLGLRLRLREGESLRLGTGLRLRLNLREVRRLRCLRGGNRLLRVQRAAQRRVDAEAQRRVRDGNGGGHERGGAGIDRGHGARRGEAVEKHIARRVMLRVLVRVLLLFALLVGLGDFILELEKEFGLLARRKKQIAR